MTRPYMPIGDQTYKEWKEKNFFYLLYWYLVTRSNFDDWSSFCALQFGFEQTLEVM